MSQLESKFLKDSAVTTAKVAADAVDGTKIKLANAQALRARNAANSADIDLITLNASNEAVLPSVVKAGTDILASQSYVGSAISTAISALPDPITFKGNYNATTNSPALADTDTGKSGWLYRVTVAGSQDFGSGSITFVVGDKVVNNGSTWEKWDVSDEVTSVNGQAGVVVLTTSDVAEGSNLYYTSARFNTAFSGKSTTDLSEGSNLYFTTTRGRTAAVVNSTAGTETDQAASVSAMKSYVAANGGSTFAKQNITLVSGDVTNQYVDLAQLIKASSLDLVVSGLNQEEGVDYTLSTVGGVTRVTFAGDLATGGNAALVSGDKLRFKYAY